MSALPPPLLSRRAFSLVEMLIIMSVIIILLGLAAPAFISPNVSRDLAKSTYLIAGALDAARADAMARNTYRYVAVEPVITAGSSVIRIRTLGYRSGGRFPGDGVAPLVPLSPVLTLSNLGLADLPDNSPLRSVADQKLAELPATFRISVTGVMNNAFLFELASNGQTQLIESGANTAIAGGSTSFSRTLSHWMEMGLQPMHGSTGPAAGSTNCAVIQIAGLTGQTQIYRP